MGANVYSPRELVVSVTATPVSSLVAVTLTPGMIPPDASFTVPRIAPASAWARSLMVPQIKTRTSVAMRANSRGVWLNFQTGRVIFGSSDLCSRGGLEQHAV